MKFWFFLRPVREHFNLIWEFLKRDIAGRYRGTSLGPIWSLLVPLLMLAIYTLVFGAIFKSRFGYSNGEGVQDFALGLFCGLNIFNFFSEVMTRSPGLILQYPNYVKKVVFPLEIFSFTTTGAALFHFLVANIPLILGFVIIDHRIPFGFAWLLLLLLPLILILLGTSWILSALGVFIRDISELLPPAMTVLMFTSAIFYPISAAPDFIQTVLRLNPLALLIESARQALFLNLPPTVNEFGALVLFGLFLATAGYVFFMKSKPAFSDVI